MRRQRPAPTSEQERLFAEIEQRTGIRLYPWQRSVMASIIENHPRGYPILPTIVMPVGPSGPPPPPDFDAIPYTVEVVRRRRFWWELQIHQGPFKHGWVGDGFDWIHALGTEAHAVRKAKRIVDRLNRKRLHKRAQDRARTRLP